MGAIPQLPLARGHRAARAGIKTSAFLARSSLANPRAVRVYAELKAHESWTPEQLQRLNWEKRRKLVRYAYENVPFYRDHFGKAGITPDDLEAPSDFDRVPLLSKEDIRQNFDRLVARSLPSNSTRLSTTGGSTGAPVKVLHDARFPMEALGWRMLTWWDVPLGSRRAHVWRGLPQGGRLATILTFLRRRRVAYLDASSITQSDARNFLGKYNRLKPAFLQGYTGAIHHLAGYVTENGLAVHRPRAVWLTSSPVSLLERARIEEAFGAPAYDQYGGGEVFWLAAECSQRTGLHIFSDARHVEFVDDKSAALPPDQPGRVAVTDLENFAFPLIRYVNDDVGRALGHSCPCGLALPLMAPVHGRLTDVVRLPDGSAIAGDYLTTIFDPYPEAVMAFRVHQHSDHSITLTVVPAARGDDLKRVLDDVMETLSSKSRGQVPIRLEMVSKIDAEGGKLRFVVSDL